MRDRIASVPRGTFGSPNIMTDKFEAYYKIKGGYVELSSGRGLRGNGLWGVTVRPNSAGKSRCFHSEVAALDYIEELSAGMRFADVAIGTEFFDPFFGDRFRKTSTSDAERLTGPNEGFLTVFGAEVEVELES